MNIDKYPTTLDLFAMPDQNFFFAVKAMAHKFGWRELLVVFDTTAKGGFWKVQPSKCTDANAPGPFAGELKVTLSPVACPDDQIINADFKDSLKLADSFRGKNCCSA